jgi:hypothetical protein
VLIVIAGVEVSVATVPAKPFADTTETVVTDPPPDIVAQVLSPLKYVVADGVPVADKLDIPTTLFAREVVIAVVPEPVTAPLKVIDWFAVKYVDESNTQVFVPVPVYFNNPAVAPNVGNVTPLKPTTVNAVAPVASPVCVAFETSPLYKLFTALSPVFDPDILDVPLTANVGVADPLITTLFTDVGVIAPRVIVIAGVVVFVATVPLTPFAVVTETDVTVPPPPPVVSTIYPFASTPNILAAVPANVFTPYLFNLTFPSCANSIPFVPFPSFHKNPLIAEDVAVNWKYCPKYM